MTTYNAVFGSDTIPPSQYSYSAVSLTADTTFEWAQLATSANVISELMEVTPSASSSWVMTMPAANAVSTGSPILIRNMGADTFTVSNSTGGVITTISTGVAKLIYITDNTTAAGGWASLTYGTGSSSSDAGALAGYGTKATTSTLSTMVSVTEKASNWTVADTDRAGLFVVTSGSITASLPAASVVGNDFYIGIRNSGSGSVTIDPSGVDTIDGATTATLAPDESCYLVCSGSVWYTLGYGRSTMFQFTKLVKDVSAGGTFTLTSAEASNKLLQFTGSPTLNIMVIVPNVVAVYYTQNTYSGTNTLTIKTAAGASVVTIPNSRSILYCDGTDVVQAQTTAVAATSLAGGVAGSLVYQSGTDVTAFTAAGTAGQVVLSGGAGAPTFTDNLTVAQGGTGRQTGTTEYALVATGVTPTGAQQTLASGAVGELLVGAGAAALPAWLPKGTANQALQMNGAGTDVEWANTSAATFTNPTKFEAYRLFDGL